MFTKFDTDSSGLISRAELHAAISSESSSWAMSSEQVDALLQEYDEDGNDEVTFEEFLLLRTRISELAQDQVLSALDPTHRDLFALTQEQARLAECSKMGENEYRGVSLPDIDVIFKLFIWALIFVLALYYSGPSEGTLDALLIIAALSIVGEAVLFMSIGDLKKQFLGHGDPSEKYLHIGCLCISLLGVLALLVSDDSFIPQHTARFFAACSALCLFTGSNEFDDAVQTFTGVLRTAAPVLWSIVAIMYIYAIAGHCIFGDKALNDVDEAYFGTYSRSLTTVFRLFVGEV